MRLILLRHGRAGEQDKERWPDDRKRPLTKGGKKRLVRAAKGLARAGIPEQVKAAPSTRTMETADVMHEHAGWPKPEKEKLLNDGAEPQKMIDKLNDMHERGVQSVALVGHEPHLSALASYMLTGDPLNSGTSLKKGGAAAIDYHPQPGKSTLVWMAKAKMLGKLGGLKKFSREDQESFNQNGVMPAGVN